VSVLESLKRMDGFTMKKRETQAQGFFPIMDPNEKKGPKPAMRTKPLWEPNRKPARVFFERKKTHPDRSFSHEKQSHYTLPHEDTHYFSVPHGANKSFQEFGRRSAGAHVLLQWVGTRVGETHSAVLPGTCRRSRNFQAEHEILKTIQNAIYVVARPRSGGKEKNARNSMGKGREPLSFVGSLLGTREGERSLLISDGRGKKDAIWPS